MEPDRHVRRREAAARAGRQKCRVLAGFYRLQRRERAGRGGNGVRKQPRAGHRELPRGQLPGGQNRGRTIWQHRLHDPAEVHGVGPDQLPVQNRKRSGRRAQVRAEHGGVIRPGNQELGKEDGEEADRYTDKNGAHRVLEPAPADGSALHTGRQLKDLNGRGGVSESGGGTEDAYCGDAGPAVALQAVHEFRLPGGQRGTFKDDRPDSSERVRCESG